MASRTPRPRKDASPSRRRRSGPSRAQIILSVLSLVVLIGLLVSMCAIPATR